MHAYSAHACCWYPMSIRLRTEDDPLTLTKLEIAKKKAAPADKGHSASAGCDQCHSTAGWLRAVFQCCYLEVTCIVTTLRHCVVQVQSGQKEAAKRQHGCG